MRLLRPPGHQPCRGFTLIELAIVLAVSCLLAAASWPSYSALVARQQLQSVVQQLQVDMALAREQASRLARPVTLSFQPGAQWCYALSANGAVSCHEADGAVGIIKRVSASDHPGVLLLEAQAMAWDPRTGGRLGQEGLARFASRQGQQLQVGLNRLGRGQTCTPSAAVAGTPRCATVAAPL